MKAILYQRPNGKQKELEVTHINPEDEKYLIDNQITVSMEEVPPNSVGLYAKYSQDPNVDEAFVLVSMAKGGHAGFAQLVVEIKRLKGEMQ